jgi:hypothetical protein
VTTLAAAVDTVDKLWTIDTMPDAPFLEAGDELVEISARFPEHIYAPTQETIPAKIRVRRAMAGTTAATHAQGITLTPVYPESATSGVGALTLLDSGPLVLPAADNTTLFEDDLPQGTFIVQTWCLMRQDTGDWVDGSTLELILVQQDGSNGADLVRYDLWNALVQGVDGPYWMVEAGVDDVASPSTFRNAPRAAYVLDAAGGKIEINSSGTITTLDIRVFALIAPPA